MEKCQRDARDFAHRLVPPRHTLGNPPISDVALLVVHRLLLVEAARDRLDALLRARVAAQKRDVAEVVRAVRVVFVVRRVVLARREIVGAGGTAMIVGTWRGEWSDRRWRGGRARACVRVREGVWQVRLAVLGRLVGIVECARVPRRSRICGGAGVGIVAIVVATALGLVRLLLKFSFFFQETWISRRTLLG